MKSLSKSRYLIWLVFPALVWWALKDVPLGEIAKTLGSLNPAALLILFALNGVILVLFSSRWWLILRDQGYPVPYRSLVGYRLAAFGLAYFTPGPQVGGEPLQVHLLQRRHRVPGTAAVASVSLDRLLEWFVNFAFLLTGVIIVLEGGLIRVSNSFQIVATMLALLALPSGYLLSLWKGHMVLSWLLGWLSGWFTGSARLRNVCNQVSAAECRMAQSFRERPVTIFVSLFLSGITWLALGIEFWLVLKFLGTQFSLIQIILIMLAARLAFLTPLPGGLGALEAGQVMAMSALGASPSLGISLSLLMRARDITLGGLGLALAGLLTPAGLEEPPQVVAGD
ncbi:MAG: lysylphosphatidylglycerol synthase transmembrane domain-containing protein [Anaerolineales bacterium]